MRAIQFRRFGGPEVLSVADLPSPTPGPGQQVITVDAAGVNYADAERVAGSYGITADMLPFVPGSEVVGRAADGRRMLALTVSGGGYAERAVVADEHLVEVPERVPDGAALALLIQGLTAWHLLRSSARLAAGEVVVVHAAAGGVGSLLVQLAKEYGAGRVIAVASTPDKRETALSLGADVAVDAAAEGYRDRILDAADGRAPDVILDGTGGPLFDAAVETLADFGRLVSYGTAGGVPGSPIAIESLAQRNAGVLGFWLRPTLRLPGAYNTPLRELLGLAALGRLRTIDGGEYALADAASALTDLRARRTVGKVILRVRQR